MGHGGPECGGVAGASRCTEVGGKDEGTVYDGEVGGRKEGKAQRDKCPGDLRGRGKKKVGVELLSLRRLDRALPVGVLRAVDPVLVHVAPGRPVAELVSEPVFPPVLRLDVVLVGVDTPSSARQW